jgi:hypothetical protein
MLRRLLNELNRVKKPKSETDKPKINATEIEDMINNGSLNMDDIMKGMNGTFKNVANITTESENGEVKKEEVSEEKKEESEEKKEEGSEEKKEEVKEEKKEEVSEEKKEEVSEEKKEGSEEKKEEGSEEKKEENPEL